MNLRRLTLFFFVILLLGIESIISEETTAASGDTTATSGETTVASGETTATSLENTATSSETSVEITSTTIETTSASGEITSASGEATAATVEITSTSIETTSGSGETTAASGETTAASGDTTATSGQTTAASGETTAASLETTAASVVTTVASSETTAASGETTTEASETTTGVTEVESTTTNPATSFADDVTTSTQNLLGINCMVQAVYVIEDTASDFVYEIGLCGSRVKKDAAKVLSKVKKLNTYTKKVEQANKTVCKNENYRQSSDADKTPSASCVKKIQDTMDKLNSNVGSTLELLNKYYEQTTNSCASMAVLKFRSNLNNFSARVKECARLADNVNKL